MIINKINFPIYGTCILLSIIFGTLYIILSLKREKLSKEAIFYFALLNIVFAFFGGLCISNILTNSSSLSSYAGAISVIISAIIFNKIIPNKNIYLKYAIISLPLIYSIGKIGCFLAGCCYGIPYNNILSVTYTNGLNIPLFPIQIVETIVFMILFLILNYIKKNKYIIEITLIICALSKFLLDYLRYDHVTKAITMNQIISLIIIVIGIIIIIKRNLKK